MSFEKSPRHDAYVPPFEAELAQFCEKMAYDLHRRVKDEKDRLSQVPAPPLSAEKAEKLSLLEVEIKKLLEQMGALGEAAKVGEAETLMREVDSLSAEKTALTQPSQTVAMVTQEKRMVLCEICGKFFVANEQSHILGKTHIGYVMIRDFLSEYKVAKKKAKEEERLQREKEANERRKRREKEDKRRSSRGDSSVRDKYQDRDRNGSRERTRDRERSQDRRGSGRDRDEKYYDYRSGRDEGRGRHYDREPYRGHDSSDWDKYQDRDENGSRERDRERSQDRSGRSRDEKYYDYRNGRGEGRGRHYDRES